MPITAFRGFDDGLQSGQRQRDHFVVNTDLENDDLWIPYGEGAWLQPCHFNVTSGHSEGPARICHRNPLSRRHCVWLHDPGQVAISGARLGGHCGDLHL